MMVEYRATDRLPAGVPAAVVGERGRVVLLVDERLTAAELCAALTPLVTAHAEACWKPQARIAAG